MRKRAALHRPFHLLSSELSKFNSLTSYEIEEEEEAVYPGLVRLVISSVYCAKAALLLSWWPHTPWIVALNLTPAIASSCVEAAS